MYYRKFRRCAEVLLYSFHTHAHIYKCQTYPPSNTLPITCAAVFLFYFSMYYSCHDIKFILCDGYSLLCSLPSTGSPLPQPLFHWHPSIALILPFLSCQILVDATGQCLTFWRDSTIHRGRESGNLHLMAEFSPPFVIMSGHCTARLSERER